MTKSRVYVGVKWGLLTPTVMLTARYYPPLRDHIHIIREFYSKEVYLEDLINIGQSWNKELTIRKFFCDPAEPMFIARLRKSRLWAVAVEQEMNLARIMVKQRLHKWRQQSPGGLSASPECPMIAAQFPKYHMLEAKRGQPARGQVKTLKSVQ